MPADDRRRARALRFPRGGRLRSRPPRLRGQARKGPPQHHLAGEEPVLAERAAPADRARDVDFAPLRSRRLRGHVWSRLPALEVTMKPRRGLLRATFGRDGLWRDTSGAVYVEFMAVFFPI